MPELIYYQLVNDAMNKPHGGIVKPSKYVDTYVLAPAVAQTVNIPSGARVAMFSCTSDFYVNFAATAVVPGATITTGAGPELNPTVRCVEDYTSFSVIADQDVILTIAYYQ